MSGSSRSGRSNASALAAMRAPASARPTSRAGTNSQSHVTGGRGTTVPPSPAGSVASMHSRSSPTKRRPKDHEAEAHQDEGNYETNINVVVRCRGRSEREIRENSGVVLSTPGGAKGKEVALSMGPLALSNKTYSFDRVFGPEADQRIMYDEVVAPILEEMLAGYNCTIFAYGQTGTGKTYTMSGDMTDNYGTFSDYAGIIPRALYNLFLKLGAEEGDNSVKCSFIELYNEELRDLLAADDNAKVKIFEDTMRKGIVIQGMEESYIKTAEDGVKLLQEGSHKRQVAATKCNELSSRSHSVFTITTHVKFTGPDGEDLLRTGKLNLVDLAGSENIGRSGAENKRAREAGMINQSLLTLGRVINALVDKSPHIPYRESKLTRLLQDSLGGRTKTCIIATVSPAKSNLEETISTLDYAARAKNIRNKPQINQMLTKKALIREYVIEIERLKGDLQAARQKNGVFLTTESYNEMTEESESRRILNEEQQRKVDLLETQVKNTREQFEQNMRTLFELKKDLESKTRILEETKEALEQTEGDLSNTKQNLAEETVLREAHQKTEEELDTVGHELISTLGSTVNDVGELHAKIRRMAELEVVNHSTWLKSSNQIADVTSRVENEIETFTEEQLKMSDAVSTKMSKFVETEIKRLEASYAFLDSRLEGFDAQEKELSTETSNAKDEMNQVLEEIKILREDVKSRVGEGLKELNVAAQRIAAEVVDDLGDFGDQLHTSYHQLGKDFKLIFAEAQKHIIAQKAEVESLRLQLTSATEAATKASAAAQNNLEEILNEERERAAEDRRNLLGQITNLINSNADEQDCRLRKRVKRVQNEMDTAREELETAANTYGEGMDGWSDGQEKFYDRFITTKDAMRQKLARDWQEAEKRNVKIQSTTQAIHAETVQLVDAQISNVSVQMQALDKFVQRARSQNEVHHTAFVSNLLELASNVRESLSHAKNEVGTIKSDVTSLGTEISSQTSVVRELLDPFIVSTREPLSELRNSVESAPLKEYIPTGDTPSRRKQYVFPTSMPHTAPHEDILAQFRGETEVGRRYNRTPLGEKDVHSPNKSVIPPPTSADPKIGTGAAAAWFGADYANKIFGKKHSGGDGVGVLLKGGSGALGLPVPGGEDDQPPFKRTRGGPKLGVPRGYMGQGRENNTVLPPLPGRKRGREG